MRAAVVTALTGPGAVELHDVPEPVAGPGEVLVDVHAAGVVFPDVLQTRGEYQLRPELPFVPGWEVAGVVRADGHGLRAGARVAALAASGFAETVAAPAERVFPLPNTVSFEAGAALPLNYLTMQFALHRRGRLAPGETVLVHGAAGGVGTAACQLAAAHGARVLAVVSTPEKAAVARTAGAHETLPVDGFLDGALRLTGGRGVDVVVDPVGGDRFDDSLAALAPEGRLLVLGFTGRGIPVFPVDRLLPRSTEVLGVASAEFWRGDPGLPARDWAALLPLVESGAVDPPLGAVLPLADAVEALRAVDERRALGRVVLRVR